MDIEPHKKFLFYVDPSWRQLLPSHSVFMYPFWGSQLSNSSPFYKSALEHYPFDTSCYGITENIKEADAVFMPFSYEATLRSNSNLLQICIERARSAGLHLVVDAIGHIEIPYMENTSVIRYGGYRFHANPSEIYLLPVADDLLERYRGNSFSVRHKRPRASISFVGWAEFRGNLRLKAIIKELPDRLRGVVDSRYKAKKKGLFFREQAIVALKKSSLLDTRILARPSYSGSKKTVQGDMDTVRREFVDGIDECDYALEVRGNSNVSTRLAEILSLGRIPVIIDTERNFPFSDEIKYREFGIIVDFRQINQLPEIVSRFHAAISDEDFVAMQHKARDVYASYMRTDKVMPHIIRSIRKNMST